MYQGLSLNEVILISGMCLFGDYLVMETCIVEFYRYLSLYNDFYFYLFFSFLQNNDVTQTEYLTGTTQSLYLVKVKDCVTNTTV